MSEELTKQIGRQLQTRRWQLGMSQIELYDQTLDLLAEALDCDFEFKLVPRK